MNHDAQLVPVDSLKPYKGNARTHDLEVIRESLRVNGQYRPLVVRSKTREVLAGNGTLQAAIEEEWTEVWATFVDVDAKAARRINIVDNRANDLAGYDETALAAQLGALPELEGSGWSERELVTFMAKVNGPGEDTEPGEPPAKPKTKVGDLWLLGEHRLLCGDATVDSDVSRLMDGERAGCVLTDPPYGIDAPSMTLGTGKKDFARGVWDGERVEIAWLLDAAPEVIVWGGNYYAHELPITNDWLCWHKNNDGTSFGECELAWTNLGHQMRHLTHHWSGEQKGHPTQKPLPVITWCVGLTSGAVLDPFAGSGTTLVAAENLNRRCYAMEIDPGYCDVIVDRWQRHTGQEARRGQ